MESKSTITKSAIAGQFSTSQASRQQRPTSGLTEYAGAWTHVEAAHLARRCLFGPTKGEVDTLAGMTLDTAVETLLTVPVTPPSPPLNSDYALSINVPIGDTWVDKYNEPGIAFRWRRSLKTWWMGLMVGQEMNIREKMTLFWQNHFATEIGIYNDPRFGYRYLSLLRNNALGNFKTLVEEITVDPAMLRYLNGNTNIKTKPNENYARELFELFSIGKGPQIGPGNYTNYTEADILEAAKVLTGWDETGYMSQNSDSGVRFVANNHDTTTKQFSAAFQNATISDQGDQEYKALINMIFLQKETARYICRKLYRWFVYYIIDASTEQNLIEPMATMLVNDNFEIRPVLKALLKSEHFYDANNVGGLIKNPVDFVVSPLRQLEVALPDSATALEDHYNILYKLVLVAQSMQQDLMDPPSVAGWPAYYQEPQFHELWANSATLPLRSEYTQQLASERGVRYRGVELKLDPIPLLDLISKPFDPNAVVSEFAAILLPQPLPQAQLDFLKDVLIPGLPDFEWTTEYLMYSQNPTDTNLEESIRNKLLLFFSTLMRLPEFYLS